MFYYEVNLNYLNNILPNITEQIWVSFVSSPVTIFSLCVVYNKVTILINPISLN